MNDRTRVTSGSPYEEAFGFCRAIREGGRIVVAGTAPIDPDGGTAPDAGGQTRRCISIMLAAIEELGGKAEDVVRTRMFITDAGDAEEIGRAHGEAFAGAPPVSTMVVIAGLLDPRWKVEMEAEAIVPS